MPKLEKTYDARLELKLETELKQAVIQFARQEGISTNEAIRQAIRSQLWKTTTATKMQAYWERLKCPEEPNQA